MDSKDYLSLFMSTVEEYEKVYEALSLLQSLDEFYDSEIAPINILAMITRKYITRGENVHIGLIIDHMIEMYPEDTELLVSWKANYRKVYKSTVVQIDARGKQFNMIGVFEDIIYGLYLHADYDRVKNLAHSDEVSRHHMMKQLINEVNLILRQLYNYLQMKGFSSHLIMNEDEAATIIREKSLNDLNILGRGYWRNLVASPLTYEKLNELKFTDNDDKVLKVVSIFFDEIRNEHPNVKKLKKIIFYSTVDEWGDFTEAKYFIEKHLQDLGYSSRIVYNQNNNVAWVRLLKKVGEGFIIEVPQSINSECLTLIDDKRNGDWKIFALGGKVDPYQVE